MKNTTCEDTSYTPHQYHVLEIESAVQAAFYVIFMLLPLCHNIYKYVYQQARFQTFTVSVFYLFATLLCCARIAGFAAQSTTYKTQTIVCLVGALSMAIAAFSRYIV